MSGMPKPADAAAGETADPRVPEAEGAAAPAGPHEHAPPLHAGRAVVPPHPDDKAGFARVLARHDFRYLWLAQVASQLADKFFAFTLLIVTYSISQAASLPSLVMVAYTLPSVFLSAPAGVYADRHDKRTLMLSTNLIRGGLVLLVPVAQLVPVLAGHAWPLLLVTFLFSAVGQVFAPAEAASIPSLVTRSQIMSATSLFMTTVIVTLVVAVPLSPITVRLIGGDNFAPFYVAAGLFAFAAFCIVRIGSSLRAVSAGSAPESHIIQELREGLSILRHNAALRLGLLQLALALIVVFTVFALGPAYLSTEMHRSAQDTYLVLIPATAGLIVSAGALGQHVVLMTRRAMMIAALIGAGVCLIAIGAGPRVLASLGAFSLLLPVVLVVAMVFGIALGAILIPAFTVLQERTDPETRGRIFGGIFTVINGAIAVPLVAAGVAADLLHSVGGVLAVVGGILIVIAVACRTAGWQWLAVLDEELAQPPGAADGPAPA
jgi:MFS family permease